MMSENSSRPAFGRPGWRRRLEAQYGWDKEFKAAGIILMLILASLAFVRADDNTGLPGEDPKDIGAPDRSEPSTPNCVSEMFLPIPEWSRFTKMPPMPGVLTPMGVSPESLVKPAKAAVAETKPDGAPPPKPAPKPQAPAPDPDQVAISPFLMWIKDHPAEAEAAARKEAATESGTAPATPAGASVPVGPVDPYWMPPMIDSASAPAPDVQAVGGPGSAAIYSRPQR